MPAEPVEELNVFEVPDGMVLIPATEYMMGCDPEHNNGYACPSDELPQHMVSLSAFAIDVYEVTNVQYAECVAAGACAAPIATASQARVDYYQNPEYANFPMINVKWDEAMAYCTWAGKRLPTKPSGNWQHAARPQRLMPGEMMTTTVLKQTFITTPACLLVWEIPLLLGATCGGKRVWRDGYDRKCLGMGGG